MWRRQRAERSNVSIDAELPLDGLQERQRILFELGFGAQKGEMTMRRKTQRTALWFFL